MDHRSGHINRIRDHRRTSHVVSDLPPGVRTLEFYQIVNKLKAFIVGEVLSRTSRNTHLVWNFKEGGGLESSEDHCIQVGYECP